LARAGQRPILSIVQIQVASTVTAIEVQLPMAVRTSRQRR
jgi:hypothetical protein